MINISIKIYDPHGVRDVWRAAFPVLKKNIKLRDYYETNFKGSRVELKLDTLQEFFGNENDEVYFNITSDIKGRNQRFTYFDVNRSLALSFTADELLTSRNEIILELIKNIEFYNVIYKVQSEKDYLGNAIASQWFTPPNCNMYMMPAFFHQRKYFLEGAAAEMWFGESFWQHGACSREEVKACDWLHTEEWENNVLYVKAYDKEFDEAEGEQLEVQRKLLKLLFNIDENNPYGSIDEPLETPKAFSQSVLVDGGTIKEIGDLKEDG